MQFLLAVLVLLSAPGAETDSGGSRLPPQTVMSVAQAVQTGTIIASRGDSMAVRVATQSRYTHVGTVVLQEGRPVVYDSMIRIGVRCQTLEDYLESQRPCDIELFHPNKPFSKENARCLENHLREQLGRPYSYRQYVTGRKCDGLHCAEYLTGALIAGDLITAENPSRVSPGEILECLTKHHLYASGVITNLPSVPVPEPPRAKTWYGRAWQDTTQCTHGCWSQSRRWMFAK